MPSIAVIGTENYYEEKSTSDAVAVTDQMSDWWSEEIEDNSNDYDATFSRFDYEIPESSLSTSNMDARMSSAQVWINNNVIQPEYYDCFLVLDWIQETGDGWPLGKADLGEAMTDNERIGMTNFYRFRNQGIWRAPFFLEVLGEGTAFHELLHCFSAEHPDGSVNSSDEASFILNSSKGSDDDTCSFAGNSDIRTSWCSNCTIHSVQTYIENHS
ncbi:hypothetical protein ACLI4Z_09735 [Natrialbaceae archaeon A-arb3/5]